MEILSEDNGLGWDLPAYGGLASASGSIRSMGRVYGRGVNFPAAVLWDMDGTLVDTEPVWIAGERALAAAHGVEWTEADALAIVGNDLRDAAAYIRKRTNSDLEIDEIIDALGVRVRDSMQETIVWRPGALELFQEVQTAGIPQALVTMSYEYIAQPVIDKLDFAAVVTGDKVTHGKPHPEPYERAAGLLGLDPRDCVAIEDSGKGTASANAAGCHVLAVPHAVFVDPAPRRTIVASLQGIDLDSLRRLDAD